MRRLFLTLVATASLVVGVTAGQSSTGSAEASPLVLRLVSITTSSKVNDVAPKGQSLGDSEFSTSQLRNAVAQLGKPNGALVGTDRGTMTLVAGPGLRVDVTTRLPGGTIRMRGLARVGNRALILPVTGGTGRFAGARGTMTISGQSGMRASNVYRLTV